MEIAPRLHYIPVPLGQIWTGVTLVDGARLAIIDTAMRGDGLSRILPYVRENRLTEAAPLIINSHMHCDHIGSNGELTAALNAEVAAHEADLPGVLDLEHQVKHLYAAYAPWLGQGLADFRTWLHSVAGPTVAVGTALREGDLIDLGAYRFQVLHTPGHSHGCITLYDAERRVAIAGDSVQASGTVETAVPMLVDTAGYRRSLERLQALEIDLLVTCHPFRPFPEAIHRGAAVGTVLAQSLWVEARMREAVQGAATLAEATEALAAALDARPNLYAAITADAYLREFGREDR